MFDSGSLLEVLSEKIGSALKFGDLAKDEPR